MTAMIMNGNTPTSISGVPNVAVSLAITKSHASARPSAPASTWPFAAQIEGLPSSPSNRNRWGKRSVPDVLLDDRDVARELIQVARRPRTPSRARR